MDENGQIIGYCQQVAEFNKQDAVSKELKALYDNTTSGKQ
jgi:hypothetical protein